MKKIDGKKEVASTKAQEGQEIFNKSCIGCHAVGSNDSRPPSARIAPNLANFAIAIWLPVLPKTMKKT